jgi:hypothetical protein
MDYRIEEIRYGNDPKSYFIPYRYNKFGLWENFPNCGVFLTYDEALEVIQKNHVIKVKTYTVSLPD